MKFTNLNSGYARSSKLGDSPHRFTVPFVCAVLTAGLALFFLLDLILRSDFYGSRGANAVIACALVSVITVRLTVLTMSDTFDFLVPSFYLFTLVWMGLAPLAQLVLNRIPLGYQFEASEYNVPLLLVGLGILGYEAGVKFSRRITRVSSRPIGKIEVANKRLRAASICGAALVTLCVYKSGGPTILFTSRSEFSSAVFGTGDGKASGAIINAILIVVPFMLSFMWVVRWKQAPSIRASDRLLMMLTFALQLSVNNPVVQSRFWVATTYLALAGAVASGKFANFPRAMVPVSLAFLVVVFPFSDVFRYEDSTKTLEISDPIVELADKGDFDAFPQLYQTLHYVDLYGHTWGNQLLGSLLFFIPRSLWADKPVDTGSLLGVDGGLGNVNLSAPLWAEGYIDFGAPGVFLLLFAVGFMLRRLADVLASSGQGQAFAVLLGVYQFVLLRGSLLQSMGVTVAIALILLATLRWSQDGEVCAENRTAGHDEWSTRQRMSIGDYRSVGLRGD